MQSYSKILYNCRFGIYILAIHELDTFAAMNLQPQKHALTRGVKPHICLTQWKVAAWR